jgi:hypothetical protein
MSAFGETTPDKSPRQARFFGFADFEFTGKIVRRDLVVVL